MSKKSKNIITIDVKFGMSSVYTAVIFQVRQVLERSNAAMLFWNLGRAGAHFSKKKIHVSRSIHGSHLEKVKCEMKISLHGL